MFSAALFAPAMEKTIDSQHLDKPIVDATTPSHHYE
jgi:hypothetical protein